MKNVMFIVVLTLLVALPVMSSESTQSTSAAPSAELLSHANGREETHNRAVLWDNGPYITHFGTGVGGADESLLQINTLNMMYLGWGNTDPLRLADEFTVPAGQLWDLDSVTFFELEAVPQGGPMRTQTSDLNLQIWDGQPPGGSVVAGNTSWNCLQSGVWDGAYRTEEHNTGSDSSRPVSRLVCDINATLPPGSYWLDWQTDNPNGYGVPVTITGSTQTGNAIQFDGNVWGPLVDVGTQGIPFVVEGQANTLAANDTCETATVVSCPVSGGTQTVPASTEFATFTGPQSCAGYPHNFWPEVWFRVVGNGGLVTATTCSDTMQIADTYMLVFDGSCAGLGCVGGSDDTCASGQPFWSTVSWASTLGTDYYIMVGNRDHLNIDEFELTVTCEPGCQTLAQPVVTSVGGSGCDGTTSQTSPVFTWNDVADESGYRWELRDTFGTIVDSGTTGADVTSAFPSEMIPGSYSVRVQAYGDGVSFCDGQWSDLCPFEIVECESLASPSVTGFGDASCGGTTTQTAPTLSWTDVAHEDGYRWEVRDSLGGLISNGSTGPDVTSASVGVLGIGDFSVSVQAIGDGVAYCDSLWSAHCSVEIVDECDSLVVPVIASIGGASCGGSTTETSPILVWSDVDNEDGYRWEILDDFGAPIRSGSTEADVTAVNVGDLDQSTFLARVRAIGDGVDHCDSDWTGYCQFEVVDDCETLPAPEIVAVGDADCGGAIRDTSPLLSWEDLANESGYRWEVRSDSGVVVRSGTTARNATAVNLGALELGDYTARVQATGDGLVYCDGDWSQSCPFEIEIQMGVAGFTWWPDQPKEGQKVRFADLSTGGPIGWFWDVGDGWTSVEQNPSHVFNSSGGFDVSLTAEYPDGTDAYVQTLTVSGVIRCGDGVCEGDETAWSCPEDCALEPGESGRAGGSDRRPTVPAAVGGVGGTGGTFWKTEGWVFNPGDEMVSVVLEYTPLGSTEIFTAGPYDLEPRGGLYWDNLVEDLFGATGNGALWLDALSPVHFLTRSYNESNNGNFGQAVRGMKGKLTIAKGDGEVYLIGLHHDASFRSNLFFQEIDGFWVTLEIEVYNEEGVRLRRSTLDVEGHSNILKNLASLGGGGQDSAYATVRVLDGDGRLHVIGSVVDQISGDPTTVDAIHLDQVVVKHHEGTKIVDDAHHLVAVVAHTKGSQNSVWGTKCTITSPKGSADQEVTLVYVPEYDRTGVVGDRMERTATLPGGKQIVWRNVLTKFFGLPQSAKTQGALHVYSPGEVLIRTRTYNRRPDGSSRGQNLKALAVGDLIDTTTSGTVMGLSHKPGSRTNFGIAAFSDVDTEVKLSFATDSPAVLPLGTVTRTVKAESHLQVPKIFEELGLSDATLPSVNAVVKVIQGGAVYVYASRVDNASGDPTTIEATRN